MMLTLRCASDADDGISRFPVLSGPLSSCYAPGTEVPERRRMVEMLARASEKHVQFGIGDKDAVLAIGIDYINAFHEYAKELVAAVGSGVKARIGSDLSLMAKTTAERRMKKGRVAFVRIYITARVSSQEVVFRVSWSNPKDIVGRTESDAHEMALMCCQLAQAIAEEYNRNVPNASPGERVLRVVVEDHENNPGLCEEARKDTEKRMLRAKREGCGHRRCNLCTADADGNPPDSGCPLFECGRCLEVTDR